MLRSKAEQLAGRLAARTGRLVWAAFALLCACGGAPESPWQTLGARERGGLAGSRWVWLDAECSDGALELGSVGLERTLGVEISPRGVVQLTFDSELAASGCSATSVWSVTPTQRAARWRFAPEAVVALPPDGRCGADEREATEGTLRMLGDVLEVVVYRSQWCRGFDARFLYRRSTPDQLTPRALAARYIAHWNRGDAAAVAQLFVDDGALIEPFTRTDDGNYARHQGRAEVQAWLDRAFASSPWLALRLLSFEPGAGPGQWIATWDYMDANLATPLRGRNLFVIAGGEIFETELQLVAEPLPKPDVTNTGTVRDASRSASQLQSQPAAKSDQEKAAP
jgi:hypothetical protein